MRKFEMALLCMVIAMIGTTDAQTTILDDFSGPINFSQTVVLDTGDLTTSNTSTRQIVGGVGQVDTTVQDDIEQSAWIFSGQSLAIGDSLLLDVAHNGGNQDIGIYVGNTAPTFNVREDYLISFVRNGGNALNSEFSVNTPGGTTGGFGVPGAAGAVASVFITRAAFDEYDLGFVDITGASFVENTRTGTGIDASVIGLYTDIRGTGTLGDIDNFRIVSPSSIPEPASMLVLGLVGGVVTLRRKKR